MCCGLSMLSAGTPMFFMGEEIVAQKPYTYNKFLRHREDIAGRAGGHGRAMFRFYQDLITLSRRLRRSAATTSTSCTSRTPTA